MSCENNDKTRWFYSGNQVGLLNQVGWFNHTSGGPAGSNIYAGFSYPQIFAGDVRRDIWNTDLFKLSQEVLDASFPFMELNWICDIILSPSVTFRVSNKNIYVEDENGAARFYEARVSNAPVITISLGEWLSENYEVGEVSLNINNRDGYYNKWLPQGEEYTQWMGSQVSIKVGYGEKLENYHEVFKGFIPSKKGVTSTVEELKIKCYEQLQNDDTQIPASTFDSTNFPFVDPAASGKAIPIIYGNWDEDVEEYGDIPAFCTNALDADSPYYVFKISENALTSIGNVYLHRGDRTPSKFGPLLLLDNVISKAPEDGRIIIPKGIECLSEPYIIMNTTDAGSGSGIDVVKSNSPTVDFVSNGVAVGDRVYIDGTSIFGVVTQVNNAELNLSGGVAFPSGTRYKVATTSYTFRKGDKISLRCVGKKIDVHSINRIADSGLLDSDPSFLSSTLTNSYWFCDNTKKEIYEVSFKDEILQTIAFSEIDSSLNQIDGLAFQIDGSLWIAQESNSSIYHYLVETKILGSMVSTLQIQGLWANLDGIKGLAIDAGNLITIYDRVNGFFYRYNPFGEQPTLVNSFSKNTIDPAITDVVDISYDVNENELILIDGTLNKLYRADPDTGLLIANSVVQLETDVYRKLTAPIGVSYSEDKTLYIGNQLDNSIYNYNEFADTNFNPGFIARDIVQSYGGLTAFDFDLQWNQTCRENLSKYRGRLYIDKGVTSVKAAQQFLRSYSTSLYLRHSKFSIFSADFDSFRTNGDIIREGDMIKGSFNPSKEYNQYFNSVIGTYSKNPYDGKTIDSDNYISPSGVQLSGKEILKKLNLDGVYRREDVDELMPLFVRLAASEPEFINVEVGFRFLFIQMNTFFNINFIDFECGSEVSSGRRFDNVPSFVRKISMDLNKMTIKLKLWSLGTTAFSGYNPVGLNSGGYQDEIILTNLGTVGYISPVGKIVSGGENIVVLESVGGEDAETRNHAVVGKAWENGYFVDVVDGSNHEVLGTFKVLETIGNQLKFENVVPFSIVATEYNSGGMIVGGMFLKYPTYLQTNKNQKDTFAHFGKPIEGYAASTTEEIENQRAGLHNFSDGRLPYVLHPQNYLPSV